MSGQQPAFSTADLKEFAETLFQHVQRKNAPGKMLATIRGFVKRLEVEETADGPVLRLKETTKKDKDAFFWLNRGHMPMEFSLISKKGDCVIRSLRRVQNSGFIPSLCPIAGPVSILRDDDYEDLKKRINTLSTRKRAIVIQLVNFSSRSLVAALLRRDADVELWLQDPEAAPTASMKANAHIAITDIESRYAGDGGSLDVFLYQVSPSVRVVWVVDEFLAVSWYTMHQGAEPGQPKWVEAYGHNRPQVVAAWGSEEYDLLAEMVEDTLASMRKFGQQALALPRGRPSNARATATAVPAAQTPRAGRR